ncbi:MAG TPA: hypothetical protein VGI88_03020 [Verrucomicrobiae bacterium]|jgi:hypothetical protein
MNEPENNLQNPPRSMDSETCESLRRQINLLFGALVVTSFTLTAFLGVQARRSSLEYLVIQPRAAEADKLLQQDNAAVQSTYSKLAEFGRTHPDFQAKVLAKYKINTNVPAATPKK